MEMDVEEKTNMNINELPEEILEFILSNLSPYRDLKSSMMVCHRWHRLVTGVIRKKKQSFIASINDSKIEWTKICPDMGTHITERYSHCACYYDRSLYVFGGCTSTNTTFNDLWRFDLARREWIRPLATGTYPSPKACSSMLVYKDSLVLFGGWSHPTPYPLHQAAGFFSELHMYKPEDNRWYLISSISRQNPPKVAGHSASIIKDTMIIFGGSRVPGTGTNDLWLFNFVDATWQKIITENKRPSPRFAHTQVTIDDEHILVIGGCGGPNQIFNDMWLLSLNKEPWEWTEVKVDNVDHAAPQLWCHQSCKVNDKVVVLCKPTKQEDQSMVNIAKPSGKVWVPPVESGTVEEQGPSGSNPRMQQSGAPCLGEHRDGYASSSTESDEDGCGNHVSKNRHEARQSCDQSRQSSRQQSSQGQSRLESSDEDHARRISAMLRKYVDYKKEMTEATASVRPGCPSIRPNAMNNRQKQLEALRRMEERLRESMTKQKQPQQEQHNEPSKFKPFPTRHRDPYNQMQLHVLDISEVVQGHVSWQPIHHSFSVEAPDETTFYSLAEGRGELIMFGGIQREIQSMLRGVDLQSNETSLVSNTLYILSPLKQTV